MKEKNEIIKKIRETKGYLEFGPLEGHTFPGVDLSKSNLSKLDLQHADLEGSNFQGSNLFKSFLLWANLIDCNFNGAIVCGTDFRYARLFGADLRFKDCRGAKFWGSRYDDKTIFPDDFPKENFETMCKEDKE